ncbi:5-formyltetrahydrofolate cyclo-ligase [Sphingomonas alpina]|uniref:5-formyltetrahydrofolate cyclo-ligase n=1 Tax=Sphingomonas alpina TaxID=653931 RepID=A0A7H0LPI3_9SPHN|nr:5-formyltetrahydrofolate cyclo-ligase [Sphingomonas alpina]QNQ11586.1 5-formyltetrahydrofolate cyclo-ligase [Sphingomonas alpina]
MPDKQAVRTATRAARDAFVAATCPVMTPPPAYLERLSHGMTVASYVPMGSEADPSPLARAAVEAGCIIALPHIVNRATPMRFLSWDTEAALIAGPFGLHQPAEHAAELSPDIILAPLVAFDRSLNRLGQGAGYYDRAFLRFPDSWRIGIAWSIQQAESLPVESWDVPLHAIATEREWITR